MEIRENQLRPLHKRNGKFIKYKDIGALLKLVIADRLGGHYR